MIWFYMLTRLYIFICVSVIDTIHKGPGEAEAESEQTEEVEVREIEGGGEEVGSKGD